MSRWPNAITTMRSPAIGRISVTAKPDLVLIYGKPDAETLQLVRLGSHSGLSL